MIKIEKNGKGMIRIFTPYNPDFVKKIKCVGGRKWDSDKKCWMVPETEIDTVREYMMDVYGETDLPDESEKITVRAVFPNGTAERTGPVVVFGKEICRAWGRDSGAKVGPDVTLLSGKITSGGSCANWTTEIEEGSVFKIRNVPRKALELTNGHNVTFEEIEEPTIDRRALEEEKEKLLARLAEIEKLLA